MQADGGGPRHSFREPVWERRRREAQEARASARKEYDRVFADRLVAGFVTLSSFGVGLALNPNADIRLSSGDWAVALAFVLVSVAGVWLLTRLDRSRSVTGTCLRMGGFAAFGVVLAFVAPYLPPLLARLFP
jgi:hypothetical protein